MTTRTIELDTIFLLTISAIAGVVFATSSSHRQSYSFSIPIAQNIQDTTQALSPVPAVKTFSQISPNGAKTLKMTATASKNGSVLYEIFSSASDNQRLIYSETLLGTESISLPFNAWSPDNKLLFIQKNTPNGSEALVMNANGQLFGSGEQSFNITKLFAAKNTGNIYKETTGWASETLLILNTAKADGSKGPSYWFEVPSKAIIQLSTEF